jgi:hypothetical protein
VYETGTAVASSGALTAYSGKKTGRSPLDKRIVKEPTSENDIWWGPVNKPMDPEVRHELHSSHFFPSVTPRTGSPRLAVGRFRLLVTRAANMISPASSVWNPSQNLAQLPQDVIILGIARIARAIGRPEAAAVTCAMGGDIIVVSWGAELCRFCRGLPRPCRCRHSLHPLVPNPPHTR